MPSLVSVYVQHRNDSARRLRMFDYCLYNEIFSELFYVQRALLLQAFTHIANARKS